MTELNDFFNAGFGWECRHCSRQLEGQSDEPSESRLLTEGEAESRTPEMSTRALARWADPLRLTLLCPRCGVTETIDKR